MKLSIRAIFFNPFLTDLNSDVIHFSYKEHKIEYSSEEYKLLKEKIDNQDNYLENIKKILNDEHFIESSIYKKNQYTFLNFHVDIYEDIIPILNKINKVDIIDIEIIDHAFFTIQSNNSSTFKYARKMIRYNTPYLNRNIVYSNNLFENIKCQLEQDILTIDFSYFLDFPLNHVLMKGTEKELSLIFEFLCKNSSININDVKNLNPFIFFKEKNNQFITLALLTNLHLYSDKDYNSLQPSIDKLYMLQDLKNNSLSKNNIIKF